jgi:hypothetical protein
MVLAMFVKIEDIHSLMVGVSLMVHLSESLVTHDCVDEFEARKIGDALLLFTTFEKGTTAEQAKTTLKTEYEAYVRKSNMPYAEAVELLASIDRIQSAGSEEVLKQAAQFVGAKGEPESKPEGTPAPSVDRSKMN